MFNANVVSQSEMTDWGLSFDDSSNLVVGLCRIVEPWMSQNRLADGQSEQCVSKRTDHNSNQPSKHQQKRIASSRINNHQRWLSSNQLPLVMQNDYGFASRKWPFYEIISKPDFQSIAIVFWISLTPFKDINMRTKCICVGHRRFRSIDPKWILRRRETRKQNNHRFVEINLYLKLQLDVRSAEMQRRINECSLKTNETICGVQALAILSKWSVNADWLGWSGRLFHLALANGRKVLNYQRKHFLASSRSTSSSIPAFHSFAFCVRCLIKVIAGWSQMTLWIPSIHAAGRTRDAKQC